MEEPIRLSMLLKMVDHLFESELNKKVALMDLTHSQCRILCFLDRNRDRDIYLNDIEKKFCLKRPTVTGIIKRLEEKEFISVVQKHDDKRYKIVTLTHKSENILKLMEENLNNTERTLCSGISDEEKSEVYRILSVMLNNIRNT